MLRLIKYLFYFLFIPFWWIQLLFPRKSNIWIFGAWYGNRFSDNSKYLYKYVKENHPEIKAIWLTRDISIRQMVIEEDGISYLTNSLSGIMYSLFAKNIIVSSGKRDVNFLFINGANCIQLWHGNPMKKIGLDDKFANTHSFFHKKIVPYFFPFVCEFNYDYIVSNSEVFSDKMASAFSVSKAQIIETGCPRNDVFYYKETDEFNDKLRKNFIGCKLVYYLPTFRGHDETKSLFDLNDYNRDEIEIFLKTENIVFISKGHYVDNILDSETDNFDNNRIINLSDDKVNDINFMLKDADLLITDYSGAYFDFLLTEKPTIFAAFDLEEYKNSSREMYFNYEKVVAGPIVKNWSELFDSLRTIWNDKKYSELVKEKNAEFNKYHDAENSKRTFESILKIN